MDPADGGGSEKFRLFQKDEFEADWLHVRERTFGRVYKVKQKQPREECALKRFCTSASQTSSCREVIEKVSEISKVKFKYIVSVHGACSDPVAMVMEYMSGGSVEDLLSSHQLMWPKKLLMIHEVAMGMNFLHGMSPPLLHLNLKLSNVLLDHHLHAKISDFGLIKWEEFSDSAEFIGHLTARGNLSYIPPETFTENCDPPGTKFDVYSFAIVTWEILTQKKAFPGANMTKVLIKVSSGSRPSLKKIPEVRPQETEDMINIMQRCWQQKSSDRPAFSDTVRDTEAVSDFFKIPDVLHACKDVYRSHRLPTTARALKKKESSTKKSPNSGGLISQKSVDFLAQEDFKNFKRYLKREDVFEEYEENYRLLHYAVVSREAEAVELVLQKGAPVDSQNAQGYTPLMIGVLYQLYDICALLVKHGADVTIRDGDCWTPLHYSAQNGDDRITRLLLEQGAGADVREQDGGTPLHLAAQNGHENVVRILLPRTADPDEEDNDGRTALHLASTYGHLDIAKLLLSQGADPNRVEHSGCQALHLATEEGHFRVARLLLKRGAAVDHPDHQGYSALHWAAQKGHTSTCRLLLRRGADPNPRTLQGWTPLHLAAFKGHSALVWVLEERGASVNAQGENGWTPLHLACHQGLQEAVTALLTAGANPDLAEDRGWTPLHLASNAGCFSSVLQLIGRGAQVDTQNASQATPLHLAAANGLVPIVEALLLNGVQPDAQDANGCTARELAKRRHKHEVVQVLDSRVHDV